MASLAKEAFGQATSPLGQFGNQGTDRTDDGYGPKSKRIFGSSSTSYQNSRSDKDKKTLKEALKIALSGNQRKVRRKTEEKANEGGGYAPTSGFVRGEHPEAPGDSTNTPNTPGSPGKGQ